jgi:hypothetical protein
VTSPLNPSLGNESFVEKRVQPAKSLLVLSREIAAHGEWDEEIIRKQGIELATLASEIWLAKLVPSA